MRLDEAKSIYNIWLKQQICASIIIIKESFITVDLINQDIKYTTGVPVRPRATPIMSLEGHHYLL